MDTINGHSPKMSSFFLQCMKTHFIYTNHLFSDRNQRAKKNKIRTGGTTAVNAFHAKPKWLMGLILFLPLKKAFLSDNEMKNRNFWPDALALKEW